MEEVKQECVALDMPNGISKEVRYNQNFVYPSKETMPKHPTNSAAKRAPSLEEANKGVYRK
jgi:hypothetical protein